MNQLKNLLAENRALILIPLVFVALYAAVRLSGGGSASALEGKAAPPFQATSMDGQTVDLAKHIGKDAVLLDFWATWCGPCRSALPVVAKAAQDYRAKGVVAYAVEVSSPKDEVAGMLRELGVEIPVLLDDRRQGSAAYQVESIPQTVVIGRDGKVQYVHLGYSSAFDQELRLALDAALK